MAMTIGVAILQASTGAAPASGATSPTTVIKPSFKVAIAPEYTTAGEPTTFQITIVNTSPKGNTLGSVKISPPSGFTPPHPTPGSPLRRKTTVRARTLMVHQISVSPGKKKQLEVTVTAPAKCGSRTVLHWTSQAFVGQNGSGSRLALNATASSLGVKVLCPDTMPCGQGAVACHTSLVTSNSTYAVMSDATSGTLNQTVNVGNNLHCGPYRFRDPNWYDSDVAPATTSPPTTGATPIVDTVTYTIRNAKAKGTGFCLGAGYQFTTASGAPARPGTLPTGKSGFIGLLPGCTTSKPPCISSISQRADAAAKVGFDALMTILIPETGDPWGRA
ncbi:MAG TPA: hypothetical protein VJU80_08105 [Solirubrobacteraceae bacterium]|nr:hypothetical protein [Solirubrobacteraceae bacterium]